MSKNLLEVKTLEKYFEVSGGLFSRNKYTVKACLLYTSDAADDC